MSGKDVFVRSGCVCFTKYHTLRQHLNLQKPSSLGKPNFEQELNLTTKVNFTKDAKNLISTHTETMDNAETFKLLKNQTEIVSVVKKA